MTLRLEAGILRAFVCSVLRICLYTLICDVIGHKGGEISGAEEMTVHVDWLWVTLTCWTKYIATRILYSVKFCHSRNKRQSHTLYIGEYSSLKLSMTSFGFHGLKKISNEISALHFHWLKILRNTNFQFLFTFDWCGMKDKCGSSHN